MNFKPRPLTPTVARNAALINQLATPGLGTLMVGKITLGISQLAFALAGFCFVMIWFMTILRQYYNQLNGQGENKSVGWIGLVGAGLFFIAWVWALVTSIGLIRQARRNASAQPVPPLISP